MVPSFGRSSIDVSASHDNALKINNILLESPVYSYGISPLKQDCSKSFHSSRKQSSLDTNSIKKLPVSFQNFRTVNQYTSELRC